MMNSRSVLIGSGSGSFWYNYYNKKYGKGIDGPVEEEKKEEEFIKEKEFKV